MMLARKPARTAIATTKKATRRVELDVSVTVRAAMELGAWFVIDMCR